MTNDIESREWPEIDEVLLARTMVLTTFRRSGVGMATPVWAAKIEGRYLFTTPSSTAKVKRLAHTKRVTIGCGNGRGKPVDGPVVEALAERVNDPTLLPTFRAAMRKKGALMSRVIEIMYKVKKDERLIYELKRP
jgi:uncharacterized protein